MNTNNQNVNCSSQLQDNSIHLSQMRIYSNRSFIIWFEKLRMKLKKTIRNWHLDITVPILIVLVSLGCALYYMKDHPTQDNGSYNLAKDSGALVGVGTGIVFAMLNLHSQYHYNKRAKASQYIEQWHSDYLLKVQLRVRQILKEEFYEKYPSKFDSKLFNQCHSRLVELKQSPEGIEELKTVQSNILLRLKDHQENYTEESESVYKLLMFFEHMGQDVKLKVADSDYLKDYFYSVVITHYELLRKYIEYQQFTRCHRLMFCNFVYLAQTWEKEGSLPSLPMICKRPLILTSKDIEKVQNRKEKSEKLNSLSGTIPS
ncbi:MAG: DUF4760 domain-containing protein [Crocosphaera sp.]|nr:DUF4760 domain-containing protein [Crocosphaera sp.]